VKSTIIRIRCQPDARSAIEAKAKAAGLPLGSYMRRSALDAVVVQATRIPDEQWVELGSALTALRSVAKSLEGGRDPDLPLLLTLIAETCVHVEGMRGILLNEQGV
jgi:hypothetical protein